ncbi:MAG: glycosyltransferase family 39 protein [Candidatus Omnitrophica bacterium]|nr:glycosyltransferase family 39 protein [Candidatus Omnitrophota bacterium]
MNVKYIFLILLLAFILRVIFCFAVPIPIDKDSSGYNTLALNLISGYGLSYDKVNPTLFRGPVYPLFLAGIYSIFGYNPMAARIIQSLLGMITCMIFFYLARLYINESLSCQVLTTIAFHPVLIALSSSLLSELLFTLLLGLSVIVLTNAFSKQSKLFYFLSGLLFGITALTRSITAYFVLFLLFTQLIFNKNKKLILNHICLFLCGQLLIIIPWTVRNYAVSGKFCPVATGGGIALWLGTYTPGRGYDLGMSPKAYQKYEEIVGKGQSYTTITNDKKLFKASLENIKNDPIGYLLLMPIKFQRMFISSYSSFFNLHQIPLSYYIKDTTLFFKNPFSLLWKVLMLVLSVATLVLGIIGVWNIRYDINRFFPLLTVIVFFIIFHTFTFASARSGIPILPFLLIFVIIGVNNIFSRSSSI